MTPIQKLEAEYVNWDALPDWVEWVTADSEGTVVAWEEDAVETGFNGAIYWENLHHGRGKIIGFRYDMKDINWRDCKWQRPEKE